MLTKTWNDLKQLKTTWNDLQQARNDLQRARNDLKQSTTSKKQPEMIWNNLEQKGNNMKWSTVIKKRPKISYNKQGTTWNDLHRTDSKLMGPSTWKKIILKAPLSQQSNNHFRGCNISYHLCIWKENKSKCQNQAKQSKKTLNNHLIIKLTGLAE